jgi:ribonuclease P protein component
MGRLMADGNAVNVPPFRLVAMYTDLPEDVPAQVAFAVPKRYLPLAVHRNRVRRLMREAYRAAKQDWYAGLGEGGRQCALLFVFQSRELPGWPEVRDKIPAALQRWKERHG